MIFDSLSVAQGLVAFQHLWNATINATVNGRFWTGSIWGAMFGLMAASILYFKSSRRHRIELQQMMKTTMETRQELQKTSSLYSVKSHVAQELQHKLWNMESTMGSSVKHWQSTTDAAYQTLRRAEERSSRLLNGHEITISILNETISDMKRNEEITAATVNELQRQLASTKSLAEIERIKHGEDLQAARSNVCSLREQLSEQEREAQATFEVNRLAMAALNEEIRLANDALSSQPFVVDALRNEVARTHQACEDLKESLDFSLKEQYFATRMLNGRIADLQSELATAKDENEAMVRNLCSLEAQKHDSPAIHDLAEEVTALTVQRDEANAHLEDLSSSTMTLVQAYKDLQAERDGLSVQLRRLQEFYSSHASPTPGAGFAFTLPPPLSPSRSAPTSPELITPEIDSHVHPLAKSWSTSCHSPDVFGFSVVLSKSEL